MTHDARIVIDLSFEEQEDLDKFLSICSTNIQRNNELDGKFLGVSSNMLIQFFTSIMRNAPMICSTIQQQDDPTRYKIGFEVINPIKPEIIINKKPVRKDARDVLDCSSDVLKFAINQYNSQKQIKATPKKVMSIGMYDKKLTELQDKLQGYKSNVNSIEDMAKALEISEQIMILKDTYGRY